MSFAVGSAVVVLPLGRKRGIVVEAGRGGHYRVQVENTTVSCRERDLAAAAEHGTKRRRRAEEPSPAPRDEPARAAPRVDLHGLSVDDALVRVVDAIDTALRSGADRLQVIHGKGSGRIRAALHRHLATMPAVAAVRLDPKNPGVTWLYF